MRSPFSRPAYGGSANSDRSRLVVLETPPLPCLVPEHVFDAFGWCASTTLEWRSPLPHERPFELDTPVDGSDPTRMVFVFHHAEAAPFLPRELARLHVEKLFLHDENALAPYAIDDATDGLFEHALPPRDVFWLAADNLNALYWGLHDWAHFHNHGPFEERAWTELQCDASALAWLSRNREVIGLDETRLAKLHEEVTALVRSRFTAESKPFEASLLALATR